ncbi:MAG: flagellar basal body rod C-terminal domain-containing protein [Arcobacteraceae bacterium]|nr:flagellar basal body rod C-terminal domain-containing protein [Arcobacteraceae bacterium]
MINSLFTAQSGLSVSQSAIDNISNNIANQNTEGYKKRVASISEMSSLNSVNITRGVKLDGISRITNEYMYNNLISTQSRQSYFTYTSDLLSDVESVFYETDDSGLTSELNRLFQSIENLRSDPTNSIYKNDLITNGSNIVDTISNIYSDLEREQDTTKTTLYQDVEVINSILNQIGSLNEQMGKTTSSNAANDLLDKRDALEQELAQYVDIEVDRNEPYQLKIGGEVAVRYNTNIHEVKVVESYVGQKDVYSTSGLNDSSITDGDVFSISLNQTLSMNITVDGSLTGDETDIKQQIVDAINSNTEFSPYVVASLDNSGNLVITSLQEGDDGAFNLEIANETTGEVYTKSETKSKIGEDKVEIQIFDESLQISSGTIKAQLETINTTNSSNYIQSYKDALDTFVSKLSELTTLESGESLFSGSDVATFAFNEDAVINLTTTDLENLSQLQWVEDIDFGNGQISSLSDFISALRVQVSADKENTDFKLESQDVIVESLQNSYNKLVNVDSDEEMINLMMYQSAYEANAKLVTVVDEMLQTILNMR